MQRTGDAKAQGLEKKIRALQRQIVHLKSLHQHRADELLGLKKAVETMQQGVTLKDMDGHILYSNSAEARMHGYTLEELAGREGRILGVPADRRRMTRSQIKKMTSWRRDRINVRKDGSTFPVQILSDVVTNCKGNPIEIITTCKDITERRRIEEILRRSMADNQAILNAVPDPLFHISGGRDLPLLPGPVRGRSGRPSQAFREQKGERRLSSQTGQPHDGVYPEDAHGSNHAELRIPDARATPGWRAQGLRMPDGGMRGERSAGHRARHHPTEWH